MVAYVAAKTSRVTETLRASRDIHTISTALSVPYVSCSPRLTAPEYPVDLLPEPDLLDVTGPGLVVAVTSSAPSVDAGEASLVSKLQNRRPRIY